MQLRPHLFSAASALLLIATAQTACHDDGIDDVPSGAAGRAGSRAGAGGGGTAGRGGSATTGGSSGNAGRQAGGAGGGGGDGQGGGDVGGQGGSVAAGGAGQGGTAAGQGGATAGQGGTIAGQGGTTAGQGGTTAGQGGTTAGQGGTTAGQGGTTAGQGGTTAGQGGTTAGQGGTTAGQGGTTAGQGGTTAGQGGATAGGFAGAPTCAGTAVTACGSSCRDCTAQGVTSAAGTSPACEGGLCRYTLATAQPQPLAIATNGVDVFWSTFAAGAGTVQRLSRSGGAPKRIDEQPESYVYAIAADSTAAYWTSNKHQAIVQSVLSTSTYSQIFTGQPQAEKLAFLSATNTLVWGRNYYGLAQGSIHTAKPGGAVKTLYTNIVNPQSIAANADYIFWIQGTTNPGTTGSINRIGYAADDFRILSSNQTFAFDIVVFGPHIYWNDRGDSTMKNCSIYRANFDGSGKVTVVSDENDMQAFAVDASGVYWGTRAQGDQPGEIRHLPLGAATPGVVPSVIATDQRGPNHITLDGSSVYWTTTGTAPTYPDGTINRALKP